MSWPQHTQVALCVLKILKILKILWQGKNDDKSHYYKGLRDLVLVSNHPLSRVKPPTFSCQTTRPLAGRRPSIQPVREPRLQLIEHVVLHGRLQAFMPEGLLRLAQIAL